MNSGKKPVRESAFVLSRVLMPSDANPLGNVHGGVIMKEIDNAAAIAAVRHCRNVLVTASIDRLNFHAPAMISELLILKASVNYVGETSMEIGVRAECESLLTGKIKHIASAYLTMVAIDRRGKPKKIECELELETDDDRRRHEDAIERRKARALERETRNAKKN